MVRAIGLLALAMLAACGSATELPPAAEPAASPPLTERPAGRVVRATGDDRPGAVAEVDGGRALADGRPGGVAEVDGGRATADDRTGGVAEVDGGRALAVVSRRERVLEVYDRATRRRIARAPAGVGPTNVAGGPGGLVYVVDTAGDGLLVFELRPRLRLTRRLPILGKPYGIALDPARGRLWVTTTATNRLVELAGGARPHRLRDLPAVRQPDAVAVRGGRVYVSGRADGVLQIVDTGAG